MTLSTLTLIRRPAFSLPRLLGFNLGRNLAAINNAITRAHGMAYVEPFASRRATIAIVLEGTEAGRDPNW